MSHLRRSIAAGSALAVTAALLAATIGTPADAAGRKGSAKFAATSYVSGQGFLQVSGKVPGGKRKVQLQVGTKGGWLTLKSKRSKRNGTYLIAAPLNWYGGHKVRVTTVGRPGFTKAKKVTVSTGYAPVGSASDFALLDKSITRTPRFDPCSTVKYKVNVDDVGPVGVQLAQAAMAQVSAASGIKVKYTGTTSFIPAANNAAHLPGNTNLVVAWATGVEVPDFISVGADGFGGPRYVATARNASGKRVKRTTEAGVTLKTEDYFSNYQPNFEGPSNQGKPPVGNLLLHEIGHAFGLDHSKGTDEMMFGGAWTPEGDGIYRSRFAAGDLTGMKKMGLGQGCLNPVRGGRLTELNVPAPTVR